MAAGETHISNDLSEIDHELSDNEVRAIIRMSEPPKIKNFNAKRLEKSQTDDEILDRNAKGMIRVLRAKGLL